MAWAKSALANVADGAVFLADELEVAQGRQNRTWGIRPGQLLITIALKPENLATISPEDLPIRLNQLNMALALGILGPIKEYGVGLKWPNDFVIAQEQDNQKIYKKISGMLVHLVWHEEKPIGIVLGFGMNVNTIFTPEDELFDIATSLLACSQAGTPIDMRTLYKKLLASLDMYYTQWKQLKFTDIYTEWRKNQVYLGRQLTIHQKDGTVLSGTMTQVMPNGDLMIKTDQKIQIIPFYTVEDVKAS